MTLTFNVTVDQSPIFAWGNYSPFLLTTELLQLSDNGGLPYMNAPFQILTQYFCWIIVWTFQNANSHWFQLYFGKVMCLFIVLLPVLWLSLQPRIHSAINDGRLSWFHVIQAVPPHFTDTTTFYDWDAVK